MIQFLSSWAKGIGVTVVIVSILEMILPNNSTKKYIKMVLGIYLIFNIITPFINNKDKLNFENINDLIDNNTIDTSAQTFSNTTNQTSMDERIEELYNQELKKDITAKVEEQGYNVISCNVVAEYTDKLNEISKIELELEKMNETEIDKRENTQSVDNDTQVLENKIVTEIQEIKKINTKVTLNNDTSNSKTKQENNQETLNKEQNNSKKLTKAEIQSIKKFLIEEYGVKEKCLVIN